MDCCLDCPAPWACSQLAFPASPAALAFPASARPSSRPMLTHAHDPRRCRLLQHPPPGHNSTAELSYSRAQLLTNGFLPQETTSGSQLCSAELQPAPDRLPLGSTHPQCPWSHRARGARKVGPGSRPLPEGIEVCCRPGAPSSSAWLGAAAVPATHCRHSIRLSEKPASAVHRNWSSGRRSLSERPSTRCSDSRAVPAPGAAITSRCPASHVPPCCAHRGKSLSTF